MIFSRKPMEFSAPFAAIPDEHALDRVLDAPGLTLLYLHDPWCPINLHAMRQLSALPGPIHSIDVSSQRDLSQVVAKRTAIRHESPQAILLQDGVAIWHASHYAISDADVLAAIADAGTAAGQE